MITLQDIFLDLSAGEFSHLELGAFAVRDPASEPDPRSYRQLISHINLGMTALHSEFRLRMDELTLTLDSTVSEYVLDYRWAVSNVASVLSPKYITDTVADPFDDNILRIEEVYDEDDDKVALNDSDADYTLFTPRFNTLQVLWPNELSDTLTVKYRADHPKIEWSDGMDPTVEYLNLPPQLREALLFYVASRVYAGINTERPEANDYYRKYLAKLDDTRKQGLYTIIDINNARFTEGGWV